MPKRVEVQGYGVIEFPDEMPDEQIAEAIRTQIAQPAAPTTPVPTGMPPGAPPPTPYGSRVPEIIGNTLAEQATNLASRIGLIRHGSQPQPATAQAPPPEIRAPSFLERMAPTMDPMTGLPISRTPQEAQSLREGIQSGARQIAPIAIGAGASAIGGAIGSLAGPLGALGGEMAGGYLGRQANIALGMEEPGRTGDLIAGLSPAGVRIPLAAARSASRMLGKHLPGAAGALHEEAALRASKLPEIIDIPVPSDLLFSQVSVAGRGAAPIPAPTLMKEAERILERQAARGAGAEIPGLATIAQGIVDDLGASGGQLNLMQVAEKLKAYGKLSGVIQDRTGEATSYGKALFKALNDDIDQAIDKAGRTRSYVASPTSRAGGVIDMTPEQQAMGSQLEVLKQARSIFRREAARYDLSDVVAKSISTADPALAMVGEVPTRAAQTRTDQATHIDPRKITDFVKRNEFFRASLTKPELDDIEATLKQIQAIPKLPPPKGANAGSFRMAQLGGVGGAIGAGIGGYFGAPGTGAAIGAASSIMANWAISQALMTPTGRRLLLRVIQPGPMLSPTGMAMLVGGLSAETRQVLGQ